MFAPPSLRLHGPLRRSRLIYGSKLRPDCTAMVSRIMVAGWGACWRASASLALMGLSLPGRIIEMFTPPSLRLHGSPKRPRIIYDSKLRPEYTVMVFLITTAGRQTMSREQILRDLLRELMNLYAPSQAHISIILPGRDSPTKAREADAAQQTTPNRSIRGTP